MAERNPALQDPPPWQASQQGQAARKPKVVHVVVTTGALLRDVALTKTEPTLWHSSLPCPLCGYTHIPQLCPSGGCTQCQQLWHGEFSCGRRARK